MRTQLLRSSLSAFGVGGLAAISVALVACSDQVPHSVAGPFAPDPLAAASVFSVMWLPGGDGSLRLADARHTDARGRLVEKHAKTLVSPNDSVAANALRRVIVQQHPFLGLGADRIASLSRSIGGATLSSAGEHAPTISFRMKGRQIKARTEAGNDVRVVVVPDGSADHKPSPMILTYTDNKLAMVTENEYSRDNAKWKVRRSRNTTFDAHGKVTAVVDRDFDDQRLLGAVMKSGLPATLTAHLANTMSMLARAALPDELRAETMRPDDDGSCITLGIEMSIALAGASAAQTIANGAIAAADAASGAVVLAIATCAIQPETCPAVAIAEAAYDAAVTLADGSQAAALAASALAASLSVEWDACMRNVKKPVDGSSSGNGDGEGDGGSWTCYFVTWYDGYGDVVGVDDLGCAEDPM